MASNSARQIRFVQTIIGMQKAVCKLLIIMIPPTGDCTHRTVVIMVPHYFIVLVITKTSWPTGVVNKFKFTARTPKSGHMTCMTFRPHVVISTLYHTMHSEF